MTESDRFPERIQRPTWIGAIGLLLTVIAFALVAGAPGALASVVLVPIWLLFPGIYAVALGHVLLAAFVVSPDVLSVLAVELGLLVVLADAAYAHPRPGALFANTVFAAGGLVLVVATILVAGGGLWIAGAGLLATLAVLAYGLHRYERTALGEDHDV